MQTILWKGLHYKNNIYRTSQLARPPTSLTLTEFKLSWLNNPFLWLQEILHSLDLVCSNFNPTGFPPFEFHLNQYFHNMINWVGAKMAALHFFHYVAVLGHRILNRLHHDGLWYILLRLLLWNIHINTLTHRLTYPHWPQTDLNPQMDLAALWLVGMVFICLILVETVGR